MTKFTNLSKAFLPLMKQRKTTIGDVQSDVGAISLGHSPTALAQGTTIAVSAQEAKDKQQTSISARPGMVPKLLGPDRIATE